MSEVIQSKCVKCGDLSPSHCYVGGKDGVEPLCVACLCDEFLLARNKLAAMTKEANHLEELKNHNAELLAESQARVAEYERTEPLKIKERNELRNQLTTSQALVRETNNMVKQLQGIVTGDNRRAIRFCDAIADLRSQIEAMKQCSNCVNKENDAPCYNCRDKSLWKFRGNMVVPVNVAKELEKELAACQARVEQQKTVLKMKSDWLDTANKTISCREAQCNILKARVAELEKQVKLMKCCDNCVAWGERCNDKASPDFEECWKGLHEVNPPMFRCADRDDGCGHCPRSEPHTHPDEQPGDDCDRMGKKVTCERV